MEVHLKILERLNNSEPPTYRKRAIQLSSDSLTLGSDPSADVALTQFKDPFLIEIKNDGADWYVVNHLRQSGMMLNQNALLFQHRLSSKDQIVVQGHRIVFEILGSSRLDTPKFSFAPGNDGALWDYLLSEETFDEVMINGPASIYVDYRGNLFKSPWKFSDPLFLTDRIQELSGKGNGWFSGRLNRTLRMQGALPPAVEAPHLSIRKAKRHLLSLEQLSETGFGSVDQMQFLMRALDEHQNIVISGGTSTGKTVLLRSLVEKIPAEQRIVLIEEETELDWPHPHLVSIEAGRGNLATAIVEALRMRPSRLIVGEVRGPEAFEMLQAMNTGHSGSLTTLHANSAREALTRLETLLLSSGVNLTVTAARRQIAQAVQIIVQLGRDAHGKRHIDHIVRVTGIQNETILLSDPVALEPVGVKQVSLGSRKE